MILFIRLFIRLRQTASLPLLALCLLSASCQPGNRPARLQTGSWRAEIASPGGALPFGLDIARRSDTTFAVHVINGTERLPMDEASLRGDTLHIPMRLFDAEIVARATDSLLTGYFSRTAGTRTVRMDFKARHGTAPRFAAGAAPATDISGKYDVLLYNDKDSSRAVGVFTQKGSEVSGSFLTPTGDYRYLAGSLSGDSLRLSTFDGSHVYLFRAAATARQLTGEFWSGDRGYRRWTATRNEQAALPDANTYTLLKKGYDALSFSFPNLDGKPVSLADARYRGKVVIVQILGSWCPNCMDESQFLGPWHQKNKGRGVEIIGLAFEKSTDLAAVAPKLRRMKQRFGMDYEVLLAGRSDSTASQALPMLEKIKGYPTTIFIDRKGKVQRIHTGFTGPGTGRYYDAFVEEFNAFVDKLVAEK